MKLLRWLWSEEPVLASTIIPFAATLGVITTDQSTALTQAVQAATAAITLFVPAAAARARVDSPATKQREAQPGAL